MNKAALNFSIACMLFLSVEAPRAAGFTNLLERGAFRIWVDKSAQNLLNRRNLFITYLAT